MEDFDNTIVLDDANGNPVRYFALLRNISSK